MITCEILNKKNDWVPVIVRPDYYDGADSGPVAWLRDADKPEQETGVALSVAGNDRTAIAHSLTWVDPWQGQTRNWQIDGKPVPFEQWEQALVEACDQQSE